MEHHLLQAHRVVECHLPRIVEGADACESDPAGDPAVRRGGDGRRRRGETRPATGSARGPVARLTVSPSTVVSFSVRCTSLRPAYRPRARATIWVRRSSGSRWGACRPRLPWMGAAGPSRRSPTRSRRICRGVTPRASAAWPSEIRLPSKRVSTCSFRPLLGSESSVLLSLRGDRISEQLREDKFSEHLPTEHRAWRNGLGPRRPISVRIEK